MSISAEKKHTLSVVIIAQNEERIIGLNLASVQSIADEIILVDSGSTDRTEAIARSHGVKFIHQDWLGYAAQKNFALNQASCDWILSLDADEVLTPELQVGICHILSQDISECCDGWKIARLMYVGDKAIKHGGFYPDAQLRLFKKGKGYFKDRLVHESIVLEGKICNLKGHLLHYSYRDLSHFIETLDKYALLAAKQAVKEKKAISKANLLNLIFHPIWTFVYRYFFRLGFLDGLLGLQMNISYANYVRNKIIYFRKEIKVKNENS